MKLSARIWNTFLLIFGVLCILYYLGMGLSVRFGQSMLFLWPLAGVFCIGRWYIWRRAWRSGKTKPFSNAFLIPLRCLIALGLCVFVYIQCLIIPAAFKAPPSGLDAVIVLGTRVNDDGPSGSLWERITTAANYLRENPETLCIASGGQGEDEPMSEASCIRDELLAAGIAPERILLEERSTSTEENLAYALPMLTENCTRIGLVTNDFHIYRALQMGAQQTGLELYGVSARSSIFGFIHYAVREFCALIYLYIDGTLPLPI